MGLLDTMKQVSEMKKMQKQIESLTEEYSNGGITVSVRGDLTVSGIKITPETWAEVCTGNSARFETMLHQVINNALAKMKKTTQQKIASMAGLPAGGGALGKLFGK